MTKLEKLNKMLENNEELRRELLSGNLNFTQDQINKDLEKIDYTRTELERLISLESK